MIWVEKRNTRSGGCTKSLFGLFPTKFNLTPFCNISTGFCVIQLKRLNLDLNITNGTVGKVVFVINIISFKVFWSLSGNLLSILKLRWHIWHYSSFISKNYRFECHNHRRQDLRTTRIFFIKWKAKVRLTFCGMQYIILNEIFIILLPNINCKGGAKYFKIYVFLK